MAKSLFGKLLASYRDDYEISQSQLVRDLQEEYDYVIHVSTVNKYESGERHPGGDFVAYVSEYFELSETEVSALFQAIQIEGLERLTKQYDDAKSEMAKNKER